MIFIISFTINTVSYTIIDIIIVISDTLAFVIIVVAISHHIAIVINNSFYTVAGVFFVIMNALSYAIIYINYTTIIYTIDIILYILIFICIIDIIIYTTIVIPSFHMTIMYIITYYIMTIN